MVPSYAQNTAKSCEIHGTVNLPFKQPVHEGYILNGGVQETRAITHAIPQRKLRYRAITPAITHVITQLERDNPAR